MLYEDLIEKFPQNVDEETPFHLAAQLDHLSICLFLFEKSTNENPKAKEYFIMLQDTVIYWNYVK
jgi:hypothetical protein